METTIQKTIKELQSSLALGPNSSPFEWRRTMQAALDTIYALQAAGKEKENECVRLAAKIRAMTLATPRLPEGLSNMDEMQASFECLMSIVARLYKVNVQAIVSPNRAEKLVSTRIIIANIFRDHYRYEAPYKWIGERLGGRDHSSVMYYIKVVDEKLDEEGKENMMTAGIMWTEWLAGMQKPDTEARL